MDDKHHIDESFKQRFSDLKDHSTNPSEQWFGFESKLSMFNTVASSAGSSSIVGVSFLKMAASIVSVIGLAGLTTQDARDSNQQSTGVEKIEVFSASSYDFSNSAATSMSNGVIHTEFTAPIQQEEVMLASTDGISDLVFEEEIDEYYSPSISSLADNSRPSITGMLRFSREESPAFLVDENRSIPKNDFNPKYYSPVSYYARAAIRVGNGESNSRVIENSTTLNGVLGIGLAYSITPNTFLSIEANYLKRSGNGIERSKEYDIDPVVSAFSNSNYLNSNEFSAEDFRVQKSLVATDLNYLHLPVMVHVVLNHQSRASIGFYTDYLISVRNESFMIYNSEHYITTKTFLAEERSKKGLNSMRYGLMAGYQHSINSKISLDARAMLPISSSYDRSSEYDIEREPNQLVDLNIGLIYKI